MQTPKKQKLERNIWLYYIITFFSNHWFTVGSWVIFTQMFVPNQHIGITEMITIIVALIVEVPSGAFADLLGKKITASIGLFFLFAGILGFALIPLSTIWYYLGTFFIISIAFPLISGSQEALIYDSTIDLKDEKRYESIAKNANNIALGGLVFGGIVGGITWTIDPLIPFVINSFSFFIAFALSLLYTEPKTDTEKFNWENFINQNKVGFKTLAGDKLIYIFIPMLVVSSIYFLWDVGIFRPLMGSEFGFSGDQINYLITLASLAGILVNYYFDKLHTILKSLRLQIGLCILMSLSFIISSLAPGLWIGLFIFVSITCVGTLQRTLLTIVVNKNTPSKYRAATISSFSFLAQIPYIFAVFAFALFNSPNFNFTLYTVIAVAALLSAVPLVLKRN